MVVSCIKIRPENAREIRDSHFANAKRLTPETKILTL